MVVLVVIVVVLVVLVVAVVVMAASISTSPLRLSSPGKARENLDREPGDAGLDGGRDDEAGLAGGGVAEVDDPGGGRERPVGGREGDEAVGCRGRPLLQPVRSNPNGKSYCAVKR